MLIRNSISNTKKFFQKTVGNLKSFFSGSHYQKLPKSSPNYNSFSYFAQDMSNTTQQNYKDLDNLYLDFTDQLDYVGKKEKKKIISSTLSNTGGQQVSQSSRSFNKPAQLSTNNKKERKEANNSNNKRMVENRGVVAKKLKELEMMDMSNLDHVLDLEEVLHYYSRLTSPVYLEIVDNFFMELYTEFFGSTTTTTTTSACYNGNNVKVDSRVIRSPSITMRSSN